MLWKWYVHQHNLRQIHRNPNDIQSSTMKVYCSALDLWKKCTTKSDPGGMLCTSLYKSMSCPVRVLYMSMRLNVLCSISRANHFRSVTTRTETPSGQRWETTTLVCWWWRESSWSSQVVMSQVSQVSQVVAAEPGCWPCRSTTSGKKRGECKLEMLSQGASRSYQHWRCWSSKKRM